ncbi:Permeases of the major facilitator superfamily protein [Enhygromyxa salina]|uniref:Permeases of the major facilitator superfamily protein n=1 Tax=Enhygromyxa salina TaxID=215803 RepID=A0A0C2CPL0_9BACT|nr:Permeases of the major facilitator superfamily protein [Enhygromyxa salina]
MTREHALAVLIVLSAINFVNYIDRYVLAAVLESVRVDFGLGDADAGLLGLMFMVVYMIASPFTGWLGDRSTRKYLVAGGVALWSLATVGSGYAESYGELMVSRALVGIGEAGYATVAPAMIADLFAPQKRGRMLAYFYLAIPMGSALGYVLGGAVAGNWEAFVSPELLQLLGLAEAADPGWRLAFLFAGAPGLLFAIAAMALPEPVRGGMDGDAGKGEAGLDNPWLGIKRLFRSPGWRATTGGMVLMTFTLGGLAFWMPTFFQRAHGMGAGEAGTVFGGVTVVAGLIATLVGGWLGDRAFARGQGGYLRVSGWGLLLGAPVVLGMGLLGLRVPVLALTFVAEFFLFLNTGPLNAALVGCVPANLRASSIAVNVLMIHALGDAISPYLIGAVSEGVGPALAGSVFGATAEIAGLRLALMVTAVPLAIGGLWLLRGAGALDRNPQGLAARD